MSMGCRIAPVPVLPVVDVDGDDEDVLALIRSLNYSVDVDAINPLDECMMLGTRDFLYQVSAERILIGPTTTGELRIRISVPLEQMPVYVFGLSVEVHVKGYCCGYKAFDWVARLEHVSAELANSRTEQQVFMTTENGLHTATATFAHGVLKCINITASIKTIEGSISSSGLLVPPLALPPPAYPIAALVQPVPMSSSH